MVTNYIGAIEQARHSGMAAQLATPTLQMNDRSAFYSVTWCASSIAHDSIHSKLYHDYLKQHPEPVPDDVWTGEAVEKQCSGYQLRLLRKIGAPWFEIQACGWDPTNRYWEVDYDKRDW